jgi:hypothetical protein
MEGASPTTSENDKGRTCLSQRIYPTAFRPLPARRLKFAPVGTCRFLGNGTLLPNS